MPFLRSIETLPERVDPGRYPFNIPCLADGLSITFKTDVTFLVGENGSGKSTILEAIAEKCGYNLSGGNRDHHYLLDRELSDLAQACRVAWNRKTVEGFFMRAETFFNFATHLDEIGSTFRAYGGKSLHQQSHGESFLSLFVNRFESGLYILDEPEAALSPARQLSLLVIIHDLERSGHAQFIIATHSPITIMRCQARHIAILLGTHIAILQGLVKANGGMAISRAWHQGTPFDISRAWHQDTPFLAPGYAILRFRVWNRASSGSPMTWEHSLMQPSHV